MGRAWTRERVPNLATYLMGNGYWIINLPRCTHPGHARTSITPSTASTMAALILDISSTGGSLMAVIFQGLTFSLLLFFVGGKMSLHGGMKMIMSLSIFYFYFLF